MTPLSVCFSSSGMDWAQNFVVPTCFQMMFSFFFFFDVDGSKRTDFPHGPPNEWLETFPAFHMDYTIVRQKIMYPYWVSHIRSNFFQKPQSCLFFISYFLKCCCMSITNQDLYKMIELVNLFRPIKFHHLGFF